MKEKIASFCKKYKHALLLLYFFIYLPWFSSLEYFCTDYSIVHITLDDKIPFIEAFVIPYYIWFVFVAATVVFMLFFDKAEYYRICAFLFIGMTVCLIIYTIWPNGQDLRPNLDTLGRSNIFTRMVGFIYSHDTCTNACPSIHVFNSIGCAVAIMHSQKLKGHNIIRYGSIVLAILISLSTVFIKQHSAFDVMWASVLAIIMYIIVYIPDYSKTRIKNIERKAARKKSAKI